ncbi:MAG TPA: glucose-6-phosphate dehydrogenase [Acidimicrobiales bacterium]|nr:glucose-6-phosphate dehydrogenase [Acidimicrobiales bacterium]
MSSRGSMEGQIPEDAVLMLFGATGDLAKRKLLPGLFHLDVAGLMPKRYRIVGSAPAGTGADAESFGTYVHDVLKQFGRRDVTDRAWESFGANLSFAPSSTDDLNELAAAVAAAEQGLDHPQRVIYLAVPPSAFLPMAQALSAAGLVNAGTKLIIEKPFGSDLASARELNEGLHKAFDESQIYRIDHFLGKEAVQNILVFRFGNGLFEPAWHRDNLQYVQVDVPEKLTVDDRGAFYEATGSFRDMVVTHLFQLLGYLAMEPPADFDAASLHKAKLAVFEAMTPLDKDHAVFGQYDGYRSVAGVAKDSTVETFVAAAVSIDNARWSGVPFYLRTGKAMAETRTTVTLGFKEPNMHMFDRSGVTALPCPNELVFELTDPGSVTITFAAKQPGPTMDVEPASMSFRYADSFTVANDLEAYERLLHDVMLGDHTLFNDAAGIERLWEVAAPVLQSAPTALPYAQGSWGPAESDALLGSNCWYLPDDATG